jgi:hypothetical protein
LVQPRKTGPSKPAPYRALPSAWFGDGGKKSSRGASGQNFSLAVVGGQGSAPRLLSPEFFCEWVRAPHLKMKMEKKKNQKTTSTKIKSVEFPRGNNYLLVGNLLQLSVTSPQTHAF